MILKPIPTPRSGATIVECALVYPLTLLLVLGLIIGAGGVFRYEEVASLAREGARWAAVRGSQYASETRNSAATKDDVYTNAIKPNAVSLDAAQLACDVTWCPSNVPPDSTVTVTVTYTWLPEGYGIGPFTITSSSTMAMCY